MTGLSTPRGLIVDLVTPLDKNKNIDTQSLEGLLDRVLAYSQAIFLASPHTGEGSLLTKEQLKILLGHTLSVVETAKPILFWISRKSEEETREVLFGLAEAVEKRGLKGLVFWVDTPLSYRSNRGLPNYYRELCSQSGQSFLLYNDPDFVQRRRMRNRPLKRGNIRTSILKEMVSLEGIKGMIFRGTLERAHNYQKAVINRADFMTYDGDEARFLKHPSLSGVVSAGANLAPEAWQRITTSSMSVEESDDRYPDQVRQILETGDYVLRLHEVYAHNPAPLIKEALYRLGVIRGNTSLQELREPTWTVEQLLELVGGRV